MIIQGHPGGRGLVFVEDLEAVGKVASVSAWEKVSVLTQ